MNEAEIRDLFDQFIDLMNDEETARDARLALERQGRPEMARQYETFEGYAADRQAIVSYDDTLQRYKRVESNAASDRQPIGERIQTMLPKATWFRHGAQGIAVGWDASSRQWRTMVQDWSDPMPDVGQT